MCVCIYIYEYQCYAYYIALFNTIVKFLHNDICQLYLNVLQNATDYWGARVYFALYNATQKGASIDWLMYPKD